MVVGSTNAQLESANTRVPQSRVHGRIDFGSGRRQNGRTILPS